MDDGLQAYTLVPEPNSSFLYRTKDVQIPQMPMSGGTLGILMILSTLQYQAPHMNPTYSNAASQAGKAAFVQSGGQGLQDQLTSKAEGAAKDAIRAVGITDTEVGAVLGTAKVVRDRQIDVNGPKIYFIKTHVTVGQDHGSLGLGVNF
jgi:hypothetical protein